LKTNCISIEDERSNLGKLHCIIDSTHMEAGGVGVVPSINPGPITFEGLADTQAAKDTYLIAYYAQKELSVADKNLKEAAKRFLMSRIDPTYLQELAHGVTEFKAVSVEDLICYLQDEYPPEPEEVLAQEQLLQKDWDPNNHFESLFDSVKKGVETLLQMDAIDFDNMGKTSVKYIYNAIRSTGQFDPACFKWKALPPDERATLQQIRAYFGIKFKVYDAQRNSLHQAGVANIVQL
jgi:hypothetical protein